VLPEVELKNVSAENRKRLLDAGCITEQQFNETEPFAARSLGYAALDEGRHQAALREFDRGLSFNPKDYWSWYNRGVVLSKLNRYEEAIESNDHALSINPQDSDSWLNRSINLAILNRYEEAIENCDRALDSNPEDKDIWVVRAVIYLEKYYLRVSKEGIETDKSDWQEALNSAKQADTQEWADYLLQYLLKLAEKSNLAFVRELITESLMEERLFPLARAIDYLLSRDEALIEKLSPEVRGIVEEIVKKLGNGAGNVSEPASKKRKGKSKSTARRRTSKQL